MVQFLLEPTVNQKSNFPQYKVEILFQLQRKTNVLVSTVTLYEISGGLASYARSKKGSAYSGSVVCLAIRAYSHTSY